MDLDPRYSLEHELIIMLMQEKLQRVLGGLTRDLSQIMVLVKGVTVFSTDVLNFFRAYNRALI